MNDAFQTLTFVDSSNIIGISYDRDNLDMYVLFKGNKIYKYVEVHNMMWDRFKLSPSKGKFLAESIKNHYEAELYSEIEAYSIIGYLGDKIVVTSVDMTRGFIVYEGSKRLIVDGTIEELPVDVLEPKVVNIVTLKDVLILVRLHSENKEEEFINKALELVGENEELHYYVLALFNKTNTFSTND